MTTGRGAGGGEPLFGLILTPAILVAGSGLLWWLVGMRPLDSIEARSLNATVLVDALLTHLVLSVAATGAVIILGIPLGVLLSRPGARGVRSMAMPLLNLAQALPTIGVLVLIAVATGTLGFGAALIGLILCSIIPVVLNTVTGMLGVSAAAIEAATGIGYTQWQRILHIEFPLATPTIFAGLRTALVMNVASATLGAYINAGGLGTIIVAGLANNRPIVQVSGAALTAIAALAIDYLIGLAQPSLTRGRRVHAARPTTSHLPQSNPPARAGGLPTIETRKSNA
ncbi:ABC transporter permease [Propionicicella superfundia]|uniref:ABC transporter permease n=1 Tax=Propionicicella superfundia TaxID=348582 RepID=UPI00042A0F6E|nr:ABC transporter permease [Propionicicella superfundia]